jgi:pimeloyl-ACP methyl ester carboxylesterase
MPYQTPLHDLVVILPGILGSVLQKDGKDLWGVSQGAIWDIITSQGKSLNALNVQQDDPNAEDLGDGISAVRLVEDVTIIPGFFKVDGYTRTTRMITENFSNVTQGNIYLDPDDRAANFYHFPYDWRRDNCANAKIFKRLLDKRLKCWRKYSNNPNAKVILLAHSMGGLISRYYLEVLGGWQDCKALYTFGTPYRGSLQALDFLANGYKQAFIDLTQAMRSMGSMTSVYQLMPRYEALKIGNQFYRIAESPVDLPTSIDRAKALDALEFHHTMDRAVKKNLKDPIYLASGLVTHTNIGVMQPTKQSAELLNGKISTSEALPDKLLNRPNLSDGDGTVPKVSATPVQMNNLILPSFIAESHGALQNQPNTLLDFLNHIQSAEEPSTQDVFRNPLNLSNEEWLETIFLKMQAEGQREKKQREEEQKKELGSNGIGLSLDDLYLTNEPIKMRAKVGEDTIFNSLTACITCVSEDRQKTFSQNFTAEDGTWVMEMDNVPAGVYRVTVQTDNNGENAPNPVHNSFVVTAINGER